MEHAVFGLAVGQRSSYVSFYPLRVVAAPLLKRLTRKLLKEVGVS